MSRPDPFAAELAAPGIHVGERAEIQRVRVALGAWHFKTATRRAEAEAARIAARDAAPASTRRRRPKCPRCGTTAHYLDECPKPRRGYGR